MALSKKEQQELNDLSREQVKLQKEGADLSDEQRARMQQLLALDKERAKAAKSRLENLQAEATTLREILNTENERKGSAADTYAQAERSRILKEGELEIDTIMLQNLREKLMTMEELTEEEQELLKAAGGTLKAVDKTLGAKQALLKSQKKLNKSLGEGTIIEQKMTEIAADLVTVINSQSKAKLAFNKLSKIGDGLMMSAFKAMIEVAKEGDEVLADFRKNMQLGDQYESGLISTTKQFQHLGIGMKEAAAAQKALITTTTDYTMMNAQLQGQLRDHSAIMAASGVANADYAQGIQNSTKMMGLNAEGAMRVQGELAATARALGVEQGQMAAKYAQMGPDLAKFGDQGVQAFKDLAHAAKITGMQMESILRITNKFDTFEGAAEQAGKLNAALGGNMVNAMDLMMATDPAERFNMIRDSILDAGLTFDDMSYYQKQFYMESLGLKDMGELAQMLSGDMTDLAGAQNQTSESLLKQKERAREAKALMGSFKDVLKEVGTAILPVVQSISKWTVYLQKMGPVIEGLLILWGIWKVAQFAQTLLTLAQSAAVIWQTKSLKGLSKEQGKNSGELSEALVGKVLDALATKAQDEATDDLSDSIGRNTKMQQKNAAGKSKITPILFAFGAAMLMIGVGVYAATTGIANLADAVGRLPLTHLAAFQNIMMGFVVTLLVLVAGLMIFGAMAQGPVLAGILGIGGAILMIGIGVGIAAAGIGFMADGFAKMFQHIDLEKVAATAMLFGVLYLGAGLGFAAALGIAAIGLALGGLTLALKFMNFEKLEQITDFMSAFEGFDTAAIDNLTESVQRMSIAVNELNSAKAVLATTLVATTGMAAMQIGAVAAIPAAMTGMTTGVLEHVFGERKKSKSQGPRTLQPIIIRFGDTNETMKKFVLDVTGEKVKEVNS